MTASRTAYRPRRRTARALAPALTLLLAAPVMAGDSAMPEGCAPFLTVQARDCTVSLLWRCDVAPAGDFSEASYGPDGLESLVSYADSYQWIDSIYTWDSSHEEFLPPAKDPIDKATLLDTGIDTYDFTMHRSEPDRSYEIRVTGADMLTGETIEIDGYTLDEVHTRLEIIADDGTVEYRAQGMQYFSRDLGHFFLGPDTVFSDDGSPSDYDSSPVDIILPGEPGFAVTVPLYGCGVQDAAFTVPKSFALAGNLQRLPNSQALARFGISTEGE